MFITQMSQWRNGQENKRVSETVFRDLPRESEQRITEYLVLQGSRRTGGTLEEHTPQYAGVWGEPGV